MHGDDITVKGSRAQVEKFMGEFAKVYETKTQIMGGDADLPDSVKILNRTLTWTKEGILMEADPRHVEEVIEGLGLESAKAAVTPCAASRGDEKGVEKGDGHRLEGEEATTYRAVAARLNYFSLDRADIRYATTRACASMSRPTAGGWTSLKRIGRFFEGKPRAGVLYKWQRQPTTLRVYTDSDWAGDKGTRRSMSGGCIFHGEHAIKTWAKGQHVVALPSADAELYAGTRAATECIGVQSLMRDLGGERAVRMSMGSSAALALNLRQGLGKAKHICIQELWMQEAIKAGRISVDKFPGEHNPADLFTKGISEDRTAYLMEVLGYRYP